MPPLIEEEVERAGSTLATAAALTIVFKLVADPTFRDRALSWRFLAEGVAGTPENRIVLD